MAALEPERGGLLWDVGAGSGAVAIEWVAARSNNHAVALEHDQGHVNSLIRTNVQLLQGIGRNPSDVEIVLGDTAEILKRSEQPDAVFLGCPGFVDDQLVENLYSCLRRGGRFVSNAIQARSVNRVMAALQKHPQEGYVRYINLVDMQGNGSQQLHPVRQQLVLTKP